MTGFVSRHCEARSNEAIQSALWIAAPLAGLAMTM
jgi:hypothetical protein